MRDEHGGVLAPSRLRSASPATILVALLLVLAPVPAILHVAAPAQLDRLTVEDGIAESLQALAFAAAGALFLARAVRRRAVLTGLLGLGFVLIAGEEVSWGQRIFGIDTPSGLESSNVQGEFNLHNLEGIHQNVRALGVLVIVVLFVCVPLLANRVAPVRRLLDRLDIADVPWWCAPLALVALAYMVVPRLAGDVVFRLDETGELYVALSALAYAVHAWQTRAEVVAEVAPEVPATVDLTDATDTPADTPAGATAAVEPAR